MVKKITRIAHELHIVRYSKLPNFDQRTRKEVLESMGIVEQADSSSHTGNVVFAELPLSERCRIEHIIREEVRGRRNIARKCELSQLIFQKRYHLKYHDY